MIDRVDIPKITKPMPDDWIAYCGVCDAGFVIRAKDASAKPGMSFCPDCRHNQLKAPGVLHWELRETE